MEKLITFAVPCYNSAAYMEHCVDTLLQGGDDIEIILVDDGSTKDDTPAIIRWWTPTTGWMWTRCTRCWTSCASLSGTASRWT